MSISQSVTLAVHLVSALVTPAYPTANVVEGEAPYGDCPEYARVLVLQTMRHNDTWAGWRDAPAHPTVTLTQWWQIADSFIEWPYPEPTHFVNQRDLGLFGQYHKYTDYIRSFTIDKEPPVVVITCNSGTLFGFHIKPDTTINADPEITRNEAIPYGVRGIIPTSN